MKKTIIGVGGTENQEDEMIFDLYILAAAEVKKPKICFLGTASGDATGYINDFLKRFSRYPCEPTYLGVVSPTVEDMESFLLEQDIIYVGGGNTKSMLALWQEWGIDDILRKAYDKGIVLAGVSAGLVCWFDTCISDAYPGTYTPIPCLGFLKGAVAAHYEMDFKKTEAMRKFMTNWGASLGIGVDNGAAVHFENDGILRAISQKPKSMVMKISPGSTEIEVPMDVVYLDDSGIEKYIMPFIRKAQALELVIEEDEEEMEEFDSIIEEIEECDSQIIGV